MFKVLVNSYTCCPNMGSEQGMGWNWITSLAKTGKVELFVISEGEYRLQIEEYLRSEKQKVKGENFADSPHWTDRLHFYWNPVTPEIRKMCWNQGDWRFYRYYREWQLRTSMIARDIIVQQQRSGTGGIDILHQLNMIGFREPGFLWKVSQETGIPFVWGPVDAKDKFPLQYTEGASFKTKAFLWLKNTISVWQLMHSVRVNKAANQASVLLGASSNSVCSFKKYMGVDAILMNETGCSLASFEVKNEKRIVKRGEHLDLLWVGKMDFRKQLGLAIKSVAATSINNIQLHVVGGGDAEPYRLMAEELGINERIVWHGAVSHDEVQELMRDSDVMLFTSVAEGTPHVVLESIANGLPVICHDTCGHGDSVNEKVGIKIPLSNPDQSVKGFAEVIERIYKNRVLLTRMSENCRERARELSWENKAKTMISLYAEVL